MKNRISQDRDQVWLSLVWPLRLVHLSRALCSNNDPGAEPQTHSNPSTTMATEGLAPAFLGALQASVAVLLTIGYGVIASQYNILRDSSAKDISKLCVKLSV